MNESVGRHIPHESPELTGSNIELGAPERDHRVADYFDIHDANEWQLLTYLFSKDYEAVSEPSVDSLNPVNFYKLLTTTLHIDDENIARVAVSRFVNLAHAEYTEIEEDADQSNLFGAIEIELSKFIESKQTMHRLSVLGLREAEALKGIYNEQNLLAFAIDTAHRHADGITPESFEMIYRYRTVVRRTQEVIEQADISGEAPSHKMSTREVGWAGDVHDYSHDSNRINPRDYRIFCGEDGDEEARVITIDDIELKVVLGRRFDE